MSYRIKVTPEARQALDRLNHIISDGYDNGDAYIYLARSNASKKTSLWLIIKTKNGKEINQFADITDVGQIEKMIETVRRVTNEHDTAE